MRLLLENLLFTLLVPGTVAVALPRALLAGRPLASGLAAFAGAVLVALGAALYAWCVFDFAHFGRGTPAPVREPSRLVMRGPYRRLRNPMYVAVLAVILGQALAWGSARVALYALAVATAFQLFVVLYEEPHLRRRHGAAYVAYCARVRRWWPRWRGEAPETAPPPRPRA